VGERRERRPVEQPAIVQTATRHSLRT
jgi:hypothetical protein